MIHAAEVLKWDFDYMVLLQPTSPLRYPKQIDEAIETIVKENADSLLSVYINNRFIWDKNGPLNYDVFRRPRRQDKKWEYVENGSIYITSKEVLRKYKNRLGGKIAFYIMPAWMSYEIDDPEDIEIVEFMFAKRYCKQSETLRKIKHVILDVDGVLTPGNVIVDNKGDESLIFSRIDGKGIELLRKHGIGISIITSENSNIVIKRANKLGIDDVYVGVTNKLKIFREITEKYKLEEHEICVCGDDIQDIEIMKKAGFSACPLNAHDSVKTIAKHISNKKGGYGFVREVADMIIKS